MGYYRGDYYRGDYYRGGIGDFFKKVGGAITGAVGGFITGGPIGALTGAIGGLSSPSRPMPQVPAAPVIGSQAGILGTAVRVGAKVLPPILAGKEVIDLARGFGAFGGGNGNIDGAAYGMRIRRQ